jgi:putative nucleotidyltransferase with HDIG domain
MTTLEAIRPKIKALEAMPTVPAIVMPLTSMLQLPSEQIRLDKVVELASYDSTIAAQCLRIANSPLFGRRNTETIRSAVVALGFKRIQAIVMGCCLNNIVPADKWAIDAVTFWRHSMGCALISSKLAKMIGYPDPEKAYLAGLLHDLGILVNTLTCTEEFRQCMRQGAEEHAALDRVEAERLGFTHCQSGKILAEQWRFSADVVEVIAFHHDESALAEKSTLVSVVHLGDLLCRLRDLGYGYYEAMGVHLAGDPAWATLVKHHPGLAEIDLARFTLDIDGAMDEIVATVDAVFKPQPAGAG